MRIPSANPYTFAPVGGEFDPWAAGRPGLIDQQAKIAADRRMPNLVGRLATNGILALGGGNALSAILSPGAASASVGRIGTSASGAMRGAGAVTGAGGTTAPVAGALSRLGSIFNSNAMNLGVNAGLSFLGQRSANKANDQARADLLTSQRESLALQRQQLENEARNADLDREDARALNAAINELRSRELAAAEEERAFNRGLVEQRETRLAPYRRISEQAMNRLASIWGIG